MVIAGSPAEAAALDDFRVYLEEVIAGSQQKFPRLPTVPGQLVPPT